MASLHGQKTPTLQRAEAWSPLHRALPLKTSHLAHPQAGSTQCFELFVATTASRQSRLQSLRTNKIQIVGGKSPKWTAFYGIPVHVQGTNHAKPRSRPMSSAGNCTEWQPYSVQTEKIRLQAVKTLLGNLISTVLSTHFPLEGSSLLIARTRLE